LHNLHLNSKFAVFLYARVHVIVRVTCSAVAYANDYSKPISLLRDVSKMY